MRTVSKALRKSTRRFDQGTRNFATKLLEVWDTARAYLGLKMRRAGSTRSQSSGSEDSDLERLYSQNDDWFFSVADDRCIRCQRRVYPIERVEVGVQLHKNCFRCKECNMMLSLHNFILARVDESGEKDVFCKAHAPKPDKNRLDPEAIGIKMAVHSQQLSKTASFNTQVRKWQMEYALAGTIIEWVD